VFVLVFALAALLLLPGAASAASSTCQVYNPQTCPQGSTTATPTTISALPFTGIDVVLLLAGGTILLAGGLVVRRLSRGIRE
jgi:hypothetical protein